MTDAAGRADQPLPEDPDAAGRIAPPAGADPRRDDPPDGDPSADDPLGDVCTLLDSLPSSAAPASLTSTTIEMVAVTAGAGAGSTGPTLTAGRRRWWLVPAACVLASLLLGFLLGRATSSDPDEAILQYLPVVQHLDVLREAGSVAFLEAVAERDYSAPRRFPFGMGMGRPPGGRPAGDAAGMTDGPEGGDGESADPWPQLEETIASLRDDRPFGRETPSPLIASRREEVGDLDDDSLRRLADAATAFEALPRAIREDVIRLARALSESDDDAVERLRSPARLWHQWLAWRDPADRRTVVDLGQDERLEWLDRYAKPPGRPGGRGFPGGWPFPPEGGRGERGGGFRAPREGSERGDRRGGQGRQDPGQPVVPETGSEVPAGDAIEPAAIERPSAIAPGETPQAAR